MLNTTLIALYIYVIVVARNSSLVRTVGVLCSVLPWDLKERWLCDHRRLS